LSLKNSENFDAKEFLEMPLIPILLMLNFLIFKNKKAPVN